MNEDARAELLALHSHLGYEAYVLMLKKNSDYANGSDPYRNFRQFGLLGIVVRLGDKVARLQSYTEKGSFEVQDEGLKDTLMDIINYAVLFGGMAGVRAPLPDEPPIQATGDETL